MEWSDDLTEWVYGPSGGEYEDEENVGQVYRRHEEEDRIRWIPGYREAVEEYMAAIRAWRESWVPGSNFPPEPERVKELRAKISEWQKSRAVPPWERADRPP